MGRGEEGVKGERDSLIWKVSTKPVTWLRERPDNQLHAIAVLLISLDAH